MNFRLKCEEPNKILYTLTATMTAEEWGKVREMLDGGGRSYAGMQLTSAISDLLAQARKIYWHEPADSAGAERG